MGKDKQDNQPPDDEDRAALAEIQRQQEEAARWEAENPDPQR